MSNVIKFPSNDNGSQEPPIKHQSDGAYFFISAFSDGEVLMQWDMGNDMLSKEVLLDELASLSFRIEEILKDDCYD